jgi:hypothetical protein
MNKIENEKKTFDEWALVELFGHARIVGRVTEATIGGGAFIRVDVPNGQGAIAFTRFFGPNAIYSISPITEQTAMGMAANIGAEPVHPYDVIKKIQASQPGLLERPDKHEDEIDF